MRREGAKEYGMKHLGALALLALCIAGIASAQSQPWDTNVLNWQAPTRCTTGEPITSCPVTGYQVEQAATTAGPFSLLATVTGTTYTHTSVSAGQHCYRVIAASAQGPSQPSNVACKTNVRPAGPPDPPVLTVVPVVAGVDVSPVFTVLADGTRSNTVAGMARVGTACDGPVLFKYRGKQWRRPVTCERWGVSAAARVAAPCA